MLHQTHLPSALDKGVGAGNFLGAKDILPESPQICPKNFYAANFPHKFSVAVSYSSTVANFKKHAVDDILSFFCFWCKTLSSESDLFIYSVTNTCNFINIIKRCPNFCARIFWDFTQNFWQITTFRSALALHRKLLYHLCWTPTRMCVVTTYSPAGVEIVFTATPNSQTRPASAGISEILPASETHPHPPRTASQPAPQCFRPKPALCVWNPLKTHAVSFTASDNLFSGSFQRQRKVLKNTIR